MCLDVGLLLNKTYSDVIYLSSKGINPPINFQKLGWDIYQPSDKQRNGKNNKSSVFESEAELHILFCLLCNHYKQRSR